MCLGHPKRSLSTCTRAKSKATGRPVFGVILPLGLTADPRFHLQRTISLVAVTVLPAGAVSASASPSSPALPRSKCRRECLRPPDVPGAPHCHPPLSAHTGEGGVCNVPSMQGLLPTCHLGGCFPASPLSHHPGVCIGEAKKCFGTWTGRSAMDVTTLRADRSWGLAWGTGRQGPVNPDVASVQPRGPRREDNSALSAARVQVC